LLSYEANLEELICMGLSHGVHLFDINGDGKINGFLIVSNRIPKEIFRVRPGNKVHKEMNS